jgi:type II secretory pathway pseudopilin PulG
MNFFRKNTRGETLAETLIALSILAIGITVASTVTSSSIQNLENTVNRIVATNLAREGLEAVHNIRETNWMKFSNNKRGCWNHLPQSTASTDACTPGTTNIQAGDYIVYLDTAKRWRLEKLTTLNQDTLPVLYKLSASSEKIEEIFNHIGPLAITESLGNTTTPPDKSKTLFKRIIHIEYLNNTGNVYGDIPAENGLPADPDYNRMNVSSKVTWTRNGQTFNAELKTRFSDYLGRENLDD